MAAFGSYGATGPTPTLNGFLMANKESTVDKTLVQFSMWKSTIKIGIAPLIETDDDQIKYDFKNSVGIFMGPAKAYALSQILRQFMVDPDKTNNSGIASGQHLITICKASELGKPDAGPLLVVRKVSPEGHVEASYAYEFKPNIQVIKEFNEKTGKFVIDNEKYKNLEIEMAATQLEQYYYAMTNAIAFTVTDALYPSLDKIAAKLGVDLMSNYNSSYKSNSYFASNNNSGSAVNLDNYQNGSADLESLMKD